MIVSLLTPSRGRPDGLKDMIRSAYENATEPEHVEVRVRLDEDDPLLAEYHGVPHLLGPRATLSSYWNECAEGAAGEILMQCADDIRFRTYGWDQLVREAFSEHPDRIVYVYGRDGIADERMATHGFMHRRWYETLGYFTWPAFSSDYGDLWNHTIAEKLDRLHFIPELYTEHLHPAVGKAPLDETHRERMERDETDKNYEIWEKAQPDLDEATEKLRACMTTPTT